MGGLGEIDEFTIFIGLCIVPFHLRRIFIDDPLELIGFSPIVALFQTLMLLSLLVATVYCFRSTQLPTAIKWAIPIIGYPVVTFMTNILPGLFVRW